MNQHNFHIILTSFFYLPIICELIGVGAEQTILCPYQGQTFFLKKSAQISGSQQGEVLAPLCLLQETSYNVWRHFWFHSWGRGTCSWFLEGRYAAKHPLYTQQPPTQRSILPTASVVPRQRNPDLEGRCAPWLLGFPFSVYEQAIQSYSKWMQFCSLMLPNHVLVLPP